MRLKPQSAQNVSWAALSLALAAWPHLGLAQTMAGADAAQAQSPQAPAQSVVATPPKSPAPATVSEIVVTAQRLREARAAIQPEIGASVYSISDDAIKAMPGGDNVQLNQVILQAPGVTEDSYGQIHVRGEHNGLQYRLDGVILPEGLSVFSQALDPHLVGKIDLITGALPAEYGLDTAGIVDITTKQGGANGGSITVYGGSQHEINPSAEIHGSAGTWNYFLSVNYLQNDLGIESPTPAANPIHDNTTQFHAFGYAEDILSANSRLTLIAGTSEETFQIPNQFGNQAGLGLSVGDPTGAPTPFLSQNLNENQHENSQYGAVSYLYDNGKFTGQVSVYGRYSTLSFIPDPLGDLLFNGIAQSARKSDTAGGLQAEGVYRLTPAHTLRAGVIFQIDRSISDTSSQVLNLGANGQQIGGPPYQPVTIIDDGAKTSKTYSVYLQDEWKIFSTLTLNYGLRFDQFDGYRDENQLSPRVNLVWKITPDTTFHAGYSRYFSPPPFELVGAETISKFAGTTAAAPVGQDATPYSERANYFDVGVSQVIARHLTLGVDTYYKHDKDVVDEGQFGAPIILTPFNYATGYQEGVELDASYMNGPFSAYANFAAQVAKGKNIISSQFNFTPADLAYIAQNYIYLDHSATYTASAGASYLWHGTRVGADLLYGSGLRATLPLPGGGDIPNGTTTPAYIQVNLTASHRFANAPGGPITLRVDVINVGDRVIELRTGQGVGIFAPQYGPRRQIFGGITKEF
jgi:outer membrane receptor protein involved in Fe transport